MVYVEVEEKEIYWEARAVDDFVEGVIIQVEDTHYGNRYKLENDKVDKLYILPNHKNLQEKLDQLSIGDKVKVTFRKEVDTKHPNKLQIYKVEVWQDTAASAEKQ